MARQKQAKSIDNVSSPNTTLCYCRRAESESMVQCEKCEIWFHYECVDLTEDDISRIQTYFCTVCEDLNGIMTEWKCGEPTKAQRADKNKHYLEVAEILSHRTLFRHGSRIRQFRIRWKNYSPDHDSWVRETHLDGCLDTLQKYLKDHDMLPSTIPGLLGSSRNKMRLERRNWTTVGQIIEAFVTFKDQYFRNVSLEFGKFDQIGDNDKLYFLDLEQHCFVVLYLHKDRIGYIADGGNLFRTSINYAKEVRSHLRIRLKSCQYNHQTKLDHCGSSAVLIGLEMIRAYSKNLSPKLLISPKRLRERVIKRLHKYKGDKMKLEPLHLRKQLFNCQFCNKNFRSNAGRKLLVHMRHCSQRK